jgi:ABC-2 type transport system ATP-binding protein
MPPPGVGKPGKVSCRGVKLFRAGQATVRAWTADEPDPAASISWRTGTGRYRNVGARVRDDASTPSRPWKAYLLLRGGSPEHEPAEEVAS